jgi:hypothetical protein
MRELRLRYHSIDEISPFSIETRSTSRLVLANISPEPGSKLSESIGKELVTASLLPGHRVFFAVATDQDNEYLKSLLVSKGEAFQEFREVRDKKTTAKNLFEFLTLGRRVPVVVSTLVASTIQKEVINAAFERYQWFWKTYFIFPFVIASDEPRDWITQLAAFSKRNTPRRIFNSMIDDCRCLILTRWDHGLSFVSDKVTRPELELMLLQLATENNLHMSIMS